MKLKFGNGARRVFEVDRHTELADGYKEEFT